MFSQAKSAKGASATAKPLVNVKGTQRLVSSRRAVQVSSMPDVKAAAAERNIFLSPHPDAIRRHREAEARRLERSLALEATVAAAQGRVVNDTPSNVCEICDPSELEFRTVSGSKNNKLVVAHFKASWCASCNRMQYKLGQIAGQNPDVTFAIVDISKYPKLQEHMEEKELEGLPYFMFYKNGKCVAEFSCNLQKINTLRAEIAGHKGGDGVTPDSPAYIEMEN